MFRYVHPSFQIKHLLQVGMLEQLRDYPKNYLKLIFSGYGNAVPVGSPRWIMKSGITRWNLRPS